jgi:hypothetical protein
MCCTTRQLQTVEKVRGLLTSVGVGGREIRLRHRPTACCALFDGEE